jgi:hypothetical protein
MVSRSVWTGVAWFGWGPSLPGLLNEYSWPTDLSIALPFSCLPCHLQMSAAGHLFPVASLPIYGTSRPEPQEDMGPLTSVVRALLRETTPNPGLWAGGGSPLVSLVIGAGLLFQLSLRGEWKGRSKEDLYQRTFLIPGLPTPLFSLWFLPQVSSTAQNPLPPLGCQGLFRLGSGAV